MPTMIITIDGKVYTGLTSNDAVSRMRDAGIFTVGKSNEEYMNGVATRAKRLDGVEIRATSADVFLSDMAKHKFLTIGDF